MLLRNQAPIKAKEDVSSILKIQINVRECDIPIALLLSAQGEDCIGPGGSFHLTLARIIVSRGCWRGMPGVPNQQAHSIHSLE